jgi:hypothetical protein
MISSIGPSLRCGSSSLKMMPLVKTRSIARTHTAYTPPMNTGADGSGTDLCVAVDVDIEPSVA